MRLTTEGQDTVIVELHGETVVVHVREPDEWRATAYLRADEAEAIGRVLLNVAVTARNAAKSAEDEGVTP